MFFCLKSEPNHGRAFLLSWKTRDPVLLHSVLCVLPRAKHLSKMILSSIFLVALNFKVSFAMPRNGTEESGNSSHPDCVPTVECEQLMWLRNSRVQGVDKKDVDRILE